MAVLDRRCLGTLSSFGGHISIVNNSAQPWYPSNSFEAATDTGRNVRCLEVFWFVTSTSMSGRYVISCKNPSNAYITRLWFNSATTIQWLVMDANATQFTCTATIALSGNTNVWWHSVLFRAANNSAANWLAYHGRVGLAVDGTPSTADSWPYPVVGPSSTTGGTAGDKMRGLRHDPSLGSPNNQTHLVLGGHISTFAGTSVSSSSRILGGLAELRVWQNNQGLNPTGPDGLMDLRDQFIDSTQFPNLIHCFRLNEPSGTSITGFDDVGAKDARFTNLVGNAGLASSPIPASSGGIIVMAGGVTAAAGSATAVQGRIRQMTPATASAAASGTGAFRMLHGMVGSGTAAATATAILGRLRAMDPATPAAAGSATAAFAKTLGMVPAPATAAASGSGAFGRSHALSGSATAAAFVNPVVSSITGANEIQMFPVVAVAAASATAAMRRTRGMTPAPAIAAAAAAATILRRLRAMAGSGSGAAGSGGVFAITHQMVPGAASAAASGTATFSGGTLSAIITERESIRAPLLRLEAYMSLLDIWNGSLTILRAPRANTTSDTTTPVLRLAANWAAFKDHFLADVRPVEAETTETLARFQTTIPSTADVVPAGDRWSYAYVLPDDLIYPLRINGLSLVESAPGGGEGGPAQWKKESIKNADTVPIRKVCLLTNDTSVVLEYIYRVSDNDIDTLEPETRWAMSYGLALFVIEHFGLDDRSIARINAEAKDAMANARRISGQTGSPRMFRESTSLWVRV